MNRYTTLIELLKRVVATDFKSYDVVLRYVLENFSDGDLTDDKLCEQIRDCNYKQKTYTIDVLDEMSLRQFDGALIAVHVMIYLVRVMKFPQSYANSEAFGIFHKRYSHLVFS